VQAQHAISRRTCANRPAHLAVPAASERHHGRSSQAGCDDYGGPPPAGFLEFFEFSLLDCIGHHISGVLFGLLLNHRTNRSGGQNLKGRSLGLAIPAASAGASQSRGGTCTKGHCGTPPKTITLAVGVVDSFASTGRSLQVAPLAWPVEPGLSQEWQRAFRQAPDTMDMGSC
jgi:hypothetical protein